VWLSAPSGSWYYQLLCSKQKWLHCPKMSLINIPIFVHSSVINLWNSLDNDTRNTRTSNSFKINLKSKVVLAKIQGHFLVGDRRHNILYARLRRSCSLLKYDLFRSNIITVSRCVCGLPTFTWTVACISNRGQLSLIFGTTIIFGEILELYYLETLKTSKPKICCYRKQYRHSFRTVGDSLKKHSLAVIV
jgi:hypothetical protein